jgi:hypothetical protein
MELGVKNVGGSCVEYGGIVGFPAEGETAGKYPLGGFRV